MSTRLRVRKLPSGKRAWMVDSGRWQGARLRREFPTKAEAKVFLAALNKERRSIGTVAFHLSMRDRIEAAEARKLLGRASILEAARFFVEHAAAGGGISVAEACRQYLADPMRADMRESSRQGARWRIARFSAALGSRPLVEVTTAELADYLAQWRSVNYLNHLKYLRALFNWCIRRGWLKDNPAAVVPRPIVENKTPEVFTPEEAERLLYAATHIYPRLVPALAIGLFAGLRQAEIAALDWRHVNLAELIIRVDPEIAKTRRTRIVDILPNLAAWLKPYAQEEGRIGIPRCVYQRYLAKVLKAAEIAHWPANGLRHSFASYHVACFQDAGRTAAQLGHVGNVAVLYDHYRAVVRREDAERYWAISPSEEQSGEKASSNLITTCNPVP